MTTDRLAIYGNPSVTRLGEKLVIAIWENTIVVRVIKPVTDITSSKILYNTEDLFNEELYYPSKDRFNPVEDIFVLYNDSKYILSFEDKITLDELYYDWMPGAEVNIFKTTRDEVWKTGFLFGRNILVDTYLSKMDTSISRHRYQSTVDQVRIIKYVPYDKSLNFLTAPVQITCEDPESLLINVDITKFTTYEEIKNSPEFWDKNTLKLQFTDSVEFIESGKMVELEVKSFLDGKLYPSCETFIVDCVDGYCPHSRVTLNNGIGKIKVRALDLVSGDLLRVKINSNFYTNFAEKVIPVI